MYGDGVCVWCRCGRVCTWNIMHGTICLSTHTKMRTKHTRHTLHNTQPPQHPHQTHSLPASAPYSPKQRMVAARSGFLITSPAAGPSPASLSRAPLPVKVCKENTLVCFYPINTCMVYTIHAQHTSPLTTPTQKKQQPITYTPSHTHLQNWPC